MLGGALSDDASAVGGETWDRCVAWLNDHQPALVLVCYAFDEMRPFRLISYIRDDQQRKSLPTVLVRALPVPLGATQEAEIRESYKTLGVADFVNVRGLIEELGERLALEKFRTRIAELLRYRS
jgi:PleD family two-component response regulator